MLRVITICFCLLCLTFTAQKPTAAQALHTHAKESESTAVRHGNKGLNCKEESKIHWESFSDINTKVLVPLCNGGNWKTGSRNMQLHKSHERTFKTRVQVQTVEYLCLSRKCEQDLCKPRFEVII